MKNNWTKTTAKLPEAERIIGGDAPRHMVNDRTEKFKEIFKRVKR